MKNISAGIYPSSFTNVRFSTKTELLNVVKCRWRSRDEVSSPMGSCQSPVGGSASKAPEKCLPFYIWRTNKLKKEETYQVKLIYFECKFNTNNALK